MSVSIGNGGGFLNDAISKTFSNSQTMGSDIKNQISQLKSGDDIGLLKVQFAMGQYNAMVELTSSLSKSLSETVKSIASKI